MLDWITLTVSVFLLKNLQVLRVENCCCCDNQQTDKHYDRCKVKKVPLLWIIQLQWIFYRAVDVRTCVNMERTFGSLGILKGQNMGENGKGEKADCRQEEKCPQFGKKSNLQLTKQ